MVRRNEKIEVHHASELGDGDLVMARKLPDEQLGWWRPDAGPRSDPAAFFPVEVPPKRVATRAPDGTILWNGAPAPDGWQRFFSGHVSDGGPETGGKP